MTDSDEYNNLAQIAIEIQRKAENWAAANSEREYHTDVYQGRSIAEYFSDVPDAFKPIADFPDPAQYEALKTSLDVARQKVCFTGSLDSTTGPSSRADPVNKQPCVADKDLHQMSEVAANLHGWHGDAAKAFMTKFVYPFPAYVSNQFLLVSILYNVVAADQEMWRQARADAVTLAKNISNALDDWDSTGDTAWTMAWTILSSVYGVASAAAEADTAVRFAAISGASQIAGAVPADDHEDVSGNTAHDIVGTMKRQINDLKTKVAFVQDIGLTTPDKHKVPGIAATIRNVSAVLSGQMSSFVAPRPGVSELERQLTSMARLLYVGWVRQYLAARSAVNFEPSDHMNDQRQPFRDAQEKMLAQGISANRQVKVSARGLQDFSVRIRPGAKRTLTEAAFVKSVEEAIAAFLQDRRTKARDIKNEVFGGSTR